MTEQDALESARWMRKLADDNYERAERVEQERDEWKREKAESDEKWGEVSLALAEAVELLRGLRAAKEALGQSVGPRLRAFLTAQEKP